MTSRYQWSINGNSTWEKHTHTQQIIRMPLERNEKKQVLCRYCVSVFGGKKNSKYLNIDLTLKITGVALDCLKCKKIYNYRLGNYNVYAIKVFTIYDALAQDFGLDSKTIQSFSWSIMRIVFYFYIYRLTFLMRGKKKKKLDREKKNKRLKYK